MSFTVQIFYQLGGDMWLLTTLLLWGKLGSGRLVGGVGSGHGDQDVASLFG